MVMSTRHVLSLRVPALAAIGNLNTLSGNLHSFQNRPCDKLLYDDLDKWRERLWNVAYGDASSKLPEPKIILPAEIEDSILSESMSKDTAAVAHSEEMIATLPSATTESDRIFFQDYVKMTYAEAAKQTGISSSTLNEKWKREKSPEGRPIVQLKYGVTYFLRGFLVAHPNKKTQKPTT
jgi:hypothetical protein